jgi:hypothetical protein
LAQLAVVALQLPATQEFPDAHTVPQLPQFALSVLKSAQVAVEPALARARAVPVVPEVQTVAPIGQAGMHAPETHALPDGQAWAQAPQFALSDSRSTHASLHRVALAPHVPVVTAHEPFTQAPPAPQPVPQLPQLFGSVDVFAHVPAQFDCPAGQDTTHWPPLHCSPDAHALPHVPQFASSDCSSTHALPQAVALAPHTGTHVPPEQV